MPPRFALLPWDTQFFGYKIGSLTPKDLSETALASIISEAEHDGVVLVYIYVDPRDTLSVRSAAQAGAVFVGEQIRYIRSVPVKPGPHGFDHVRSYKRSSVNERLLSLALQSGIYSRFRRDVHFRRGEFERLYSVWIEKSVTREIAEDVLVYEEDGQELGLATLGIKDEAGDIGLFAVDEQARRRSIGKMLMEGVYRSCRELNLGMVRVVTQRENRSACRFYEGCGFSEESTVYIYHLWLSSRSRNADSLQ
jgi:dTDP-4-amino-4,6-dideoxy-D-galactose acyltransferase